MSLSLQASNPDSHTKDPLEAHMTTVPGIGPDVFRVPSLPDRVTLYEVGPRDGLQNESEPIDVGVKMEFIERLVAAGLRTIELTSTVRPDRVPQLADAEILLERLHLPPEVRTVVLVPNQRGLDRVLAHGVREIAIFASATETFSERNLGRSIDDSFAMFEPVVASAREAEVIVRAYVSMCFGDPWEGHVAVPQVVDVGLRLLDLGCHELSIGDTIGTGTPGHVSALIDAFGAAGVPSTQLAAHFHDTYGQALANVYAALEHGVTTIDASAGGLGGCPFAQSATGNVATEDVVWQLHGLGIETGIDLVALAETSDWLAGVLGRPSPSRAVRAMTARREQR
jgi:hydroxymethylglutaryl-CoA lyase